MGLLQYIECSSEEEHKIVNYHHIKHCAIAESFKNTSFIAAIVHIIRGINDPQFTNDDKG